MKYLKLFEGYQSESEVAEICEKYRIENWSLVEFGTVSGSFNCSSNQLTSLEGCPNRVGRNFHCSLNKLTSLVGCPKYVSGNFWCGSNNIREFTGIKYIGGQLLCDISSYSWESKNPIVNIWKIISPNSEWDEDQMVLFDDCSIIQDDGEAVAIDRLNFFLEEIGLDPVEKVDGYINI